MKNGVSKLGLSAVLVTLVAAAPAFAQGSGAPTTGPAQMMQDHGMMGNGGMQGTMAMLQQMGPMRETCTGMMQAMATQPATSALLPEQS
jgi:hypothetical protein